jgi:hypothetical protein
MHILLLYLYTSKDHANYRAYALKIDRSLHYLPVSGKERAYFIIYKAINLHATFTPQRDLPALEQRSAYKEAIIKPRGRIIQRSGIYI